MKTSSLRLLALSAALACAGMSGAASAGVTVKFIEPEKYIDMPFSPWEKDMVMKDLDQYLVKMGDKWLPAGQNLTLEILDIDLAGRLKMNVGREVRVLTGTSDWPMIEVR